jgi:hypothetical protein
MLVQQCVVHTKFAIYVFIYDQYTFYFQVVWRRAYFMNVILETCRPHYIRNFKPFNTVHPTSEPTSSCLIFSVCI